MPCGPRFEVGEGLCANSVYLEQYKTCASAEEVRAAQERITVQLERDYADSRRERGAFRF